MPYKFLVIMFNQSFSLQALQPEILTDRIHVSEKGRAEFKVIFLDFFRDDIESFLKNIFSVFFQTSIGFNKITDGWEKFLVNVSDDVITMKP